MPGVIRLSDAERVTFRWYRAFSVAAFYLSVFAEAAVDGTPVTLLAVLCYASASAAFCFTDGILYGHYYDRSRLWLTFYFWYVALPAHVLRTRPARGAVWIAVHALATFLTVGFGVYAGGRFE